jgi:mRNA interferase RelE/StbE
LDYKVFILPAAQKQILALPRGDQLRLSLLIDGLIQNPRPVNSKKLKGTQLWRVRSGNLRIIYSIADRELKVIIVKAARRQEDTYHNL